MSLDIYQQVLFLSAISNAVNDLKGTRDSLQRTLQDKLTGILLPIDAGWRVVWGPVVWKNEPEDTTTGPDNSWYIAFHPSLQFEDGSVHPTYAISIAVNSVADFKAWVASGIQNPPVVVPKMVVNPESPYVATGTAHAVHILLTTPAPTAAMGEATTLLDFFANMDMSSSPRFITSGHSLGGALSPSLALALALAGVIPADRTLTYPSAAPNPGNAAFTDLFIQTFPARKPDKRSSYKGWNLNLVNTLDIVPQVWCALQRLSPEQNLTNIPSIYGRPILPPVLDIFAALAVHSLSSGVLYKPLPSQYFTGPHPPAAPKDVHEFFYMAVPQHIQAYLEEVGISIPMLNLSRPISASLDERNGWFSLPIIADFKLRWALEHPEEIQTKIGTVEGAEEVIQAFRDMLKEV